MEPTSLNEQPIAAVAPYATVDRSHSPRTTDHLSTWVEVDLEAIIHNYRQVKSLVGEKVKVLGVVKANAYGHGLVPVSQALESAGIDYLGVTRLEEGIALRQAGVASPVLVFCPPLPDQIEPALRCGLTLTVDSLTRAVQIDCTTRRLSDENPKGQTPHPKPVTVHIKVDTGMGRLGLSAAATSEIVEKMGHLEGLYAEGIYSHFANAAGKDPRTTVRQMERWTKAVEQVSGAIPIAHCANSAALLRFPETHFQMVRSGNLLYGQYPSQHVPRPLNLRDTFAWKARVVSVRRLKAGDAVGYGSEWRASGDCTVATLPVGFGDGFGVEIAARTKNVSEIARQLARDARVLAGCRGSDRAVMIDDRCFLVVGRIGMQQVSLLVPEGQGLEVGDVVTLPARRLTVSASIPRIAASLNR